MKEIVIKVSDEDYKELKEHEDFILSTGNKWKIAVINGTELPKGHDRLIEAKEAKAYLYRNMEWYDEDGYITDDEEKDKALQDLIDGIPTFIEADKENENERNND